MENKYTADDLAKALINLEHKATYTEYRDFVDATTEKWNVRIENNDVYDLLDCLGVENFLDDYNEYFNKNTLHVGNVYRIIDTERPTVHGCDRAVITEYNAEEDKYYCLLSDGTFDFASNDEFDFDNAERIGSINTKTFVHSKNDLINKLNEL
jgi:2-hydroxy-3-keto-5-methylthiopentenyl-1-phosphate phosphatase